MIGNDLSSCVHVYIWMLQCEVCFIRRTSTASNAIRTIDNEVKHLIHPLFELHSVRLKCDV